MGQHPTFTTLEYGEFKLVEGSPLAESVILYTHPDCTFSDALLAELNEAGTSYEQIDLARSPERWEELEALTGGERITPVMIENGQVSVGFHGVG